MSKIYSDNDLRLCDISGCGMSPQHAINQVKEILRLEGLHENSVSVTSKENDVIVSVNFTGTTQSVLHQAYRIKTSFPYTNLEMGAIWNIVSPDEIRVSFLFDEEQEQLKDFLGLV